MIKIHVTYVTKPGTRDEFISKIRGNGIDKLSAAEDGCSQYELSIKTKEPDNLYLDEQWRDEASQDAHRCSSHFLKLQELKKEYLTDIKIESVVCGGME